jgi:hypothetical protein
MVGKIIGVGYGKELCRWRRSWKRMVYFLKLSITRLKREN